MIRKFPEAKIADLLLISQRDALFSSELESNIQAIFKLLGPKNYHAFKRITPKLASGWYYLMTTLSNLQTLGEEYTGCIRLNNCNHLPSKIHELIWLLLYIGGEPLLDRLINSLTVQINQSESLTSHAKYMFLTIANFLQEHKPTIKKFHHSLFYIKGKYYNISNRITGIHYSLIRDWLQDDSFTQSFKFLGYLSLILVLLNFVQNVRSMDRNQNVEKLDNLPGVGGEYSKRTCVLCGESLKNPSATPCGHIFCWDCIYDSLKYQHTCPICREVVTPSRVIFLQNYL